VHDRESPRADRGTVTHEGDTGIRSMEDVADRLDLTDEADGPGLVAETERSDSVPVARQLDPRVVNSGPEVSADDAPNGRLREVEVAERTNRRVRCTIADPDELVVKRLETKRVAVPDHAVTPRLARGANDREAGLVKTPSTIVLAGTGAHADRWHGLEETSGALAALVSDAVVRTTDDDPANSLTGADVVVVNVSGDLGAAPTNSAPIVSSLLDHVAAGGGLVALHSSALAFADDPRWARLLGGRWVAGVTGHPQIGRAFVQSSSTLTDDFFVYDERYTALETSPDVEVVAFHTEDGMTHPLAWLNEGAGRVAYSALGHGIESYESPNAAFTRALVSWTLRG
jgi:uncharacterized protein